MDLSNQPSTSGTFRRLTEAELAGLFPASYESSRSRFRTDLDAVRQAWPSASLKSFQLETEEDLTIDRIEAPALQRQEKLLILTTGEHGIEANVGTAMLELFINEYLPRLDPQTTGLVLVHAINPWGMKHQRRVNANNVDLNRNFLFPAGESPDNPGYDRIAAFLNPDKAAGSWLGANLGFGGGVLSALRKLGFKGALGSILLGQYQFPKGLYFGGDGLQAETEHLIEIYRNWMAAYRQVVLLDMHTGYGPRQQMSLVNSYLEQRSSAELAERYAYNPVVSTTPDEFYAIQGDMIDYVYALRAQSFPEKPLYATSFEYGTYGDSIFDHLSELRTMILENQVFHFGTDSGPLRQRVGEDFQALYFPQSADWQAKAVQDARQAFSGILRAEGYT